MGVWGGVCGFRVEIVRAQPPQSNISDGHYEVCVDVGGEVSGDYRD